MEHPKDKSAKASAQLDKPATSAQKPRRRSHSKLRNRHARVLLESYRRMLELVARYHNEQRSPATVAEKLETSKRINRALSERIEEFLHLVARRGVLSTARPTDPEAAIIPLPYLEIASKASGLSIADVGPGFSEDAPAEEVIGAATVVAWNLYLQRFEAGRREAWARLLGRLREHGEKLSATDKAFLHHAQEEQLSNALRPPDVSIPESESTLRRLLLNARTWPPAIDACRKWLRAFATADRRGKVRPTLLERKLMRLEGWMEVGLAAKYLDCDKSTATRLCDSKDLEARGHGRDRRVSPRSVLEALRKRNPSSFPRFREPDEDEDAEEIRSRLDRLVPRAQP